jgi:predicted amidohydrolase YtcJ
VHAIGDRANREVLDAYAAAKVPAERRFRIEHAQIVAPEDLPRFGAQGVVASMQPTHATSDMPWAGARVGEARLAGAYAWRSMLKGGARLVAGSDFPVEEVAPLLGLWAATTRTDAEGKPEGGWLPEQKLTLAEAIAAYTVAPAWVSFQEHHRGRIAPGFVADLTVFDRELLVDRLLETRVAMTMVGGRVVHERPR